MIELIVLLISYKLVIIYSKALINLFKNKALTTLYAIDNRNKHYTRNNPNVYLKIVNFLNSFKYKMISLSDKEQSVFIILLIFI